MEKKLRAAAAFVFGVAMCFLANSLFAQEAGKTAEESAKAAHQGVEKTVQVQAEETATAGEGTEFSYGTVKSVSQNQIVVSEYDYDSDKDVEVTYQVPATVTLENAASLQEIAVGAAVDIDFLVKDGQKVASAITVEKPSEDDEAAALNAGDGKSKTE